MSTYLYELPTTGAISFADFCIDHTGSYTTHIAEATQARANLRAALKESKRTDGEKDYLKLVKVRYARCCLQRRQPIHVQRSIRCSMTICPICVG